MTGQINRRKFLHNAATGGVAVGVASTILSSSSMFAHAKAPAARTRDKTGNKMILGEGEYQYRIDHDFLKLPSHLSWQTTHNVACLLYTSPSPRDLSTSRMPSSA